METVLTVIAWSFGGLVLLTLVLGWIEAGLDLYGELRERRRAREERLARQSMSLVVDVDILDGKLRPSVLLAGVEPLSQPFLEIELFDKRGARRGSQGRGLDPPELESELALPDFRAGELGVPVSDVVRWRWDVVLRDGKREKVRWREVLRPAGPTNIEGELTLQPCGTRLPMASVYLGGSARPPRTEEAHWWQTDFGRWRLLAETAAMARFPGFVVLVRHSPERLCWLGWLESSLNPGKRYLVSVTYPDRFPDEAPRVRIEQPSIAPSTPHVLFGNSPCLYRPVHGLSGGYDPARSTAATFVAWTALWVHAYETWQATGSWPGRGE